MLDVLRSLEKIIWSPSRATSVLLSKYDISHGFSGVGATHPDDVQIVNQVHGVACERAPQERTKLTATNRLDADAIWTTESGVAVAVRTADCLPVLLASRDGAFVAAIHAGWRGVIAGIIPKTVAMIVRECGVRTDSLVACIGPAISREQFEVGREVIDATQNAEYGLAENDVALTISKGKGDRWHFDLQLTGVLQLLVGGMSAENIEVIQACTKSSPGAWHSYRREGRGCGSNWAWIRKPGS